MCTGRVDLNFILRALANGMDGVFIGACRLNECNYTTHGNYHALSTVRLCQKIMETIGLNPERLGIAFMSSADGGLFTEVINEFSMKIKELGPLVAHGDADRSKVLSRIEEVRRLVPYIKIMKREKLTLRLKTQEEYDALYTADEMERLLSDVVSYYIHPDKCQACMICSRKCPVEAIEGGKNRVHVIDQEKCIKCGTCFEACPSRFGAVTKISGGPVPDAIPEEARVIDAKKVEKPLPTTG